MGANGSFASGSTNSELGRAYKTIGTVGEIQIVVPKNPKLGIKLPEESHTPNRIYATFYKDGHDVKGIAKYGPDGKKVWEIHTIDHKNLGPHYHDWSEGKPVSDKPLTKFMIELLEKVRNYKEQENMVSEKDFPYIGKNLLGIRYNAAYPPNVEKHGEVYGGYANNARQVILYDFAVQGYDVEFKYDGATYHLLYEPDHAALCDQNYSKEYETFANPMDLVENLRIKGHKLIDIIDELEDVEPE